MGLVYEDLLLKNGIDLAGVILGCKHEGEVREVTANFLVDTGAIPTVVSREVKDRLGLRVKGRQFVTLAGGERRLCEVYGPVEIHWHNRNFPFDVLVLPGEKKNILGVTVLEQLDLTVDPVRKRLVGANGDDIVYQVI